MLNERTVELLEERGIDAEIAAKLGVASFEKPGGDWIKIPYFENGRVVNNKYRTLSGEKRFYQDEGGRKTLWNVDVLTDQTLADQPLLVTEGEMDAIAAMQCGFQRVVSVPDGAPSEKVGERDTAKYEYLQNAPGLREVGQIILCVDGDGPGVNLLDDLAMRLGRPRCKWVKYPKGCKDLNDALLRYGEKGVVETINRAQFMRVDGVYRLNELPPVPYEQAHDLGIPHLARHYKPRLGDFVVLTGIPGHGKSAFINEVCGRAITEFGWQVAVASFEQRPQIDHRRNLRTWYHRKLEVWQTDEERDEADAWINQNFTFIVPSEDDDVDLLWMEERVFAAVAQNGAQLVVIDPWNEMDHTRPPDMTETEYTGFAIKRLKRLASKYRLHLIVAAHPVKQRKQDDGTYSIPTLYDISGSAHWYNKADVGIVVHRLGGLNENRTLIRIAKVRYHDQIGQPGELEATFSRETNRYTVIPPTGQERAA